MLSNWLNLLHTQLWLFTLAMAIFGLIIGSFLNVVIYRLPLMMKTAWRRDCREFLNLAPEPAKPLNLAWPGSHCPHCEHSLSWYQNIPLLSFIWQRGRCSHCQQHISLRYPIVELLTACAAVSIALKFGPTWIMLAVFALSAGLIVASVIDLQEKFIPDELTYIFLWLGLLINTQAVFASLTDAVIGAVAGYLILWLVAKLYLLVRKLEGIGHGDFKLLALFGAWLGWQALLPIILIGSITGVIVALILVLRKKADRYTELPFGPYLALGGWLMLLWGQSLLGWLN